MSSKVSQRNLDKSAPKKTAAPAGEKAPATPEQPERLFVIKGGVLDVVFAHLQEVPAKWANPIMNLLNQNLQEVKPNQVKGKAPQKQEGQ